MAAKLTFGKTFLATDANVAAAGGGAGAGVNVAAAADGGGGGASASASAAAAFALDGATSAEKKRKRAPDAEGDEKDEQQQHPQQLQANPKVQKRNAGHSSQAHSEDTRYCICRQPSYGDMVGCDNDDCPNEWFHFSCVSAHGHKNAHARKHIACKQQLLFIFLPLCMLKIVCVCVWFVVIKKVGLKKHPKGDWLCDECKSHMEQ